MREIHSNQSGTVYRDGSRVWIDYVPEPSVKTPFGILTGGRAYDAEGITLVEFDQLVKSRSAPGTYRKVTLVADKVRPGLLDLAVRAIAEEEKD